MKVQKISVLPVLMIVFLSSSCSHRSLPFWLSEDVLSRLHSADQSLERLPEVSSTVAFTAVEGVYQYNHGAVLFPFRGQLYLQWQSSARDEDAPDTQILYSSSEDGRSWSQAQVLAPARPGAVVTSGGWWSHGDTLVAFLNVWPEDLEPRGGFVEYIISTDGNNWSEPRPVLDDQGQPLQGVIEQDLKALPDGRILTAVHHQPGLLVAPYFTDDPLGISAWQAGSMERLPSDGTVSREIEPSWFQGGDGAVVMVFRDQESSFRVLASVSRDQGETWTTPVLTEMPDSRAKQSAGNLPDGTAFLVNNPSGSKERLPLTVTLSRNGRRFDRAYLLRGRDDLPEMRYEGRYKRIGYSYPKSLVWRDQLWVAYAVNKEDIAVTRVPVQALLN